MDNTVGYRFCTSEQVAALATIHPSFRGYDDKINAWIKQATTSIMSHCNRDFVQKTGIIEYAGTPDRLPSHDNFVETYSVHLKEPNVDLDSVQVMLSYRHVFNADTMLTGGDNDGEENELKQDYFFERLVANDDLLKITLTRHLRYHSKSLKIIYNAGYPVGDTEATVDLVAVPRELVQATALQAGYLMSRAGSEDIGTGDVRKQNSRRDPRIRPEGITAEATFLLRKWRRSFTASM